MTTFDLLRDVTGIITVTTFNLLRYIAGIITVTTLALLRYIAGIDLEFTDELFYPEHDSVVYEFIGP